MRNSRGPKPAGSSGKRARSDNRGSRPPASKPSPVPAAEPERRTETRRHVRPAPIASSRRTSTRLLPIIGAVVVVVVLAAAGYFIYSSRNAASASPLGEFRPQEETKHVAEGSAINYQSVPPSSGRHYPAPKPWGSYDEAIVPGYWVHNLEHGGVALLYNCPSGCPDVINVAHDAAKTFPPDKFGEIKVITTPYAGLPTGVQVAAVAWQYVKLYNGDFSRENILAFYNAHVDRGPEDVP